ncbi:Homolog of E. coli HemY protein [Rhodovastum atsumiense]|nr:heme biosynthesis HemY N-terminal domain-containing protein [Rhodovastum atsumiense]CAH2600671.1 Homolog of E. coli HemY protein [Rhodovastum atsumiense]
MFRVILFVATGAIAIAVAWWLAELPGTVSATVAGVTIEASTSVAIVGVAVLILVVHLLLRLLGGLLRVPGRVGYWAGRRNRAAGDAAVNRTLVALAAGEANHAKRDAERARRLLGDTPQTMLLAAEARRLAGEENIAEAIYRSMAERKDSAFLGLRGLYRQAVAREDWDAAAAIARQVEAAHPGGSWLREERAQLAVRTGNWIDALALSGPQEPVADFAVAAAAAEADPYEAARLAKRAWKADPGLTPAAIAYATRLRETGREKQALEVIQTAWAKSPHPDLATFALAREPDPEARVRAAVQLVERNADHPESHFLLAQEHLAAGLTQAAHRHAEAARRAGVTQRRLWVLLADLAIQELGDTEEGRAAQRDALRKAAAAEDDPAWRCESCGTVHESWKPACPACHTAGRIRWGVPSRLALPGPA